jgi:SIR2-like protein
VERLLAQARDAGLVVLVGAGISIPPPTSLPSWNAFNTIVLEELGKRVGEYTSLQHVTRGIESLIARRDGSTCFAPDFQAQIMEEECGADYFRVLTALDSDRRNACHACLAELAAAGLVRAIVTTNFDRLCERALEARGVGHAVYLDPEGFARLEELLRAGEPAALPVVKVHGSVEWPDSMVDTLRQRLEGRPESLERALHMLALAHPWLTLGFSGGDLDYDPDYLGLRPAAAAGAAGLTYLALPDTKPRRAIQDVLDLHGGRGRVLEGTLPDWLVELVEAAGLEHPAEPPANDGDPAAALRDRTGAWVHSLGDMAALNVLVALVEAAGDPDASYALLRRTWQTYRRSKDALGPGYARFLLNLGSRMLELGELGVALDPEDVDDSAAWENAFQFLARATTVAVVAQEEAEQHPGVEAATGGVSDEESGDAQLRAGSVGQIAVADLVRRARLVRDDPDGYRALGRSLELGIEALAQAGRLEVYRGATSRGAVGLNIALRASEELGRPATTLIVCLNLAEPYEMLGHWQLGAEILEGLYELADLWGDEPRRAHACAEHARLLARCDRGDEAYERAAEGISIAERLELPVARAANVAALGLAEWLRDRPRDAVPVLHEAAAVFRSRGRVPALTRTLLDLFGAAWSAGDHADLFARTQDELDPLLDVVQGYVPHFFLLQAEMELAGGRSDSGLALLGRAREVGALFENSYISANADRIEQAYAGG